MKNKKVQALLATTVMTAALIGGCAFNPADEEMSEVYGPAPVLEEEQADETQEEADEEELSEEKEESRGEISEEGKEDFVAESEAEVCVYGPAPVE